MQIITLRSNIHFTPAKEKKVAHLLYYMHFWGHNQQCNQKGCKCNFVFCCQTWSFLGGLIDCTDYIWLAFVVQNKAIKNNHITAKWHFQPKIPINKCLQEIPKRTKETPHTHTPKKTFRIIIFFQQRKLFSTYTFLRRSPPTTMHLYNLGHLCNRDLQQQRHRTLCNLFLGCAIF